MRIIVSFFALVIFLAALGFAGVMGLYAYYARDLPDPGALSHRQLFQTARIQDRNGKLLQEVNDPSGGRRILVTLKEIPKIAQQATIAAEDASFYDNPGFDIRAACLEFATGSSATPSQASFSAIRARIPIEFSPIPAVNTKASMPCKAAASIPAFKPAR